VTATKSGSWTRTVSLIAFMLLWQLAAMAVNDAILPSPVVVFKNLWIHLTKHDLLLHLGITLYRVAVAFIIAMAVGTLIGLLMGQWRGVDATLDSLLVLALNIPALVTIILCYIWFGLTEVAAILAVAINKIPTVVVTIREGARAVDRELLQVAQAFRLKPLKTLRQIYLPQLYPYLMASARSGLALIWKIVLVVELLGRSNGVGFQLGTFFQFFDIVGILVYTIAFASIILVIEAVLMRPLDRYISRWRT